MNNKGPLSIAAVIVTYNRKDLLLRVISAVCNQSYKCRAVYIIDNASTDNTLGAILNELKIDSNDNSTKHVDNQLLELCSDDKIKIYYFRKDKNGGGAGGFFTGLKLAHETGMFDAYWLMDDDGFPSEECLNKQLPFLSEYNYIMPVSIDIDNHSRLSWATRMRNGIKTSIYDELKQDWGEIMPFIFPFNGSLMSREMVDQVGYVNPDLFIWGDDYEHYYRCLKAGFTPITVLSAIFYHPVNKAPTVPILFGKIQVPFVDSNLRFVCLIRNWAFINKKNRRYLHLLKSIGAYSWLFLFTNKMNWSKYKLFLQSFKDGLTENFERHKQFLK